MNLSRLLLLLVSVLLFTCQKKSYPPQLTAVTPSSAVIGGDITLAGSQFGDAPTVSMGSQAVPTKTHTDNTIVVTVPNMTAGATIIRVQNADGASDPVPFTVLQPVPPPTINSISPEKGVTGTEVTLTGNNLSGVLEVKFGSLIAQIKPGGDNGKVIVSCPDFGSVQMVQVTIRTVSGTSTSQNFMGAPAPTIDKARSIPTGIIPGSALTIKGSNFSNVTMVRFTGGSVSNSQFIHTSSNELTVKVPSNTQSGLVQLVNEYGAGQGVWFDKVTGGSGLTADNIATNVGAITTGIISDGCDPTSFFYCLPNRQYEIGFKRYSERCAKTYFGTEQVSGSMYETYIGYRTTAGATYLTTGDVLKLERNNQNTNYTGLVILVTTSDSGQDITYVGSMTLNGDIYAYSITNGALLKMCKRDIKYFSFPTSTVCSDCK